MYKRRFFTNGLGWFCAYREVVVPREMGCKICFPTSIGIVVQKKSGYPKSKGYPLFFCAILLEQEIQSNVCTCVAVPFVGGSSVVNGNNKVLVHNNA